MEVSAANRHERRRTRNRDAILAAAENLFGARGIDAVSIDEIALAADLAKGTVYNHFADKDALASEIARAARADGEARVNEANAGVRDPVRRTLRGIVVFAHFAWHRPDRARAMMRLTPSAADPFAPINAGLLADITGALKAGAFRGAIEPVALVLLGIAHVMIARIVSARPARADAMSLIGETVALALQALGVAPDTANAIAAAETADIFGSET